MKFSSAILLAALGVFASGCGSLNVYRGLNYLDHKRGYAAVLATKESETPGSRAENLEKAEDEFIKATKRSPRSKIARLDLGLTYAAQGRYQEAIEQYNEAIEIDDEYAKAFNNRGAAYEKLGNYDQAKADYKMAAKLDEDLASAQYNAGRIALDKEKDADLALQYADKAIEAEDGNALYYYLRGAVHETKGNKELAKADYTKSVSIAPEFKEAQQRLAGVN